MISTVHRHDSVDGLLEDLADFIVGLAASTLRNHDKFSLALSGGSSPARLYRLLSSPAFSGKIDWQRVFLFFGDERYVPLDHPDSNYRMARETLIEPLEIPASNVFAVNTALKPAAAAADYETRIRQFFGKSNGAFDLILLGLGDNAHTASLFPHTAVLHETQALVKDVFVEEVGMYRITFTAPMINAARSVAFLVYGLSKAVAVRQILQDDQDIDRYPAQLIRPIHGELHWFLDAAAARELKDDDGQ